jgi:putative transposase
MRFSDRGYWLTVPIYKWTVVEFTQNKGARVASVVDKHYRRSIRISGYDYSQEGAYFVTICVNKRECLLGRVTDGEMKLNNLGEIVAESWQWLEDQYPQVELDKWVVMPNHIHGIIMIGCRGGSRTAPTTADRKPLGGLIGAFKTVSSKKINEIQGCFRSRFWQRNYYERIIRNERSLSAIRRYIEANPRQWENDSDNPDR